MSMRLHELRDANCIAALCGNGPYGVGAIRPSVYASIAQFVQPHAHGAR
jgi:hypothetical protein